MVWTEITRLKYRRDGLRYSSDMTDAEWELIVSHLPEARRLGRPRTADPREVLNAIFYISTSGCQWRMLPKDFPPRSTVQRYFYRWRDAGILEQINHTKPLHHRHGLSTAGFRLNQLRGSVENKNKVMEGAESIGETLALLTWVVFGAAVIGRVIDLFTWSALLYAMLSLTVIRMLPVYLCLAGTEMSMAEKLFVGWFGPRGLASIVFAIIVFDARLPGNDTVMAVIAITVLLSVVAHGVTANFLLRTMRFGDPAPTQPSNPE